MSDVKGQPARTTLTREQLYAKVGQTPMTRLAPEFGLSKTDQFDPVEGSMRYLSILAGLSPGAVSTPVPRHKPTRSNIMQDLASIAHDHVRLLC